MKKSKRLIAFLLSLALAFPGSITAHASGEGGVGANAGAQNNSASKYTSSGGNGTWRLPTNIGIRFTVTDNQGYIVGTVLGKKGSLDVVNSGYKETGQRMAGCATDPSADYFYPLPYATFMAAINKGTKQMPDWITADEVTHGAEHRAWMTTGEGGSGGGGVIRGDSATLNPNQSVNISNTAVAIAAKKVEQAQSNGGVAIDAKTLAGYNKENNASGAKPSVGGNGENAYSTEYKQEQERKKAEELKKAIDSTPSMLNKVSAIGAKALNAGKAAENAVTGEIKGMWVPQELFNPFVITAHAAEIDSGPGGGSGTSIGKGSGSGVMAEDAVESGTGTAVATDYDPDQVGYAWSVLNLVIDGQYVFQLPGGATTFSESDASKGVRPGDIFIKNDYRLVVENTIQGIPQTYNSATKSGGANWKGGYVYGTAHNWAIFGATQWLPWCGSQTFGNHQRYLTRPLPRAFVTEQDWEGVLSVPPDDAQWTIEDMMSRISTGFGTHVYYPADLPGAPSSSTNDIRTWDKPNFPDIFGPTEWPSTTPEDDSYTKTNKNNTLKITKYYQFKDVKGNIYPLYYFNTINAPHTVYIMDEVEGNGFKLMDWYESKDDFQPPEGGEADDYQYDKVKKQHFNTGITGTEEKLPHVIPPETETKVLHILLEYTGKPEPEKVTVIRVYDDEDGNPEKIEKEEIPEGPGSYKVPIDPEYEYVETKESPNPPNPTDSWEDSEGPSKGTPPTVEYPKETKTIYIHYVKKKAIDTKKIVLYENELSYNYSLKDLLKDRKLIEIYDDVPAAQVSYASCSGYRCHHTHYSHTVYCDSTKEWLSDANWTVSVKDSFDQNTLPFIKQWTYTSKMSATGITTLGGGNGKDAKVVPQATFLVIRDKEKDVVTLYPKKNDSIKGELSDLNVTENYTSTDTRYKNKRETSSTEKFYNTIRTALGDGPGRDRKLQWTSQRYGQPCGPHEKSKVYETSYAGGHAPSDANAAYSKPDNFETRYFLGSAGKGEEKPKDIRSAWAKRFKYNTSYAYTSADLSFYPYLKYVYYYKDNSSPNPVMVTSSNLSGMKVFNAIQAGVYKKNEINANLTSTQWSTHARSLSFIQKYGIGDKKTVLPGGAIQDLDMGNQGDTQIGLTIWQACLPDTQVETVQEGFKVSETEAKQAVNDLIESVKKSISGYGLVQWGQEGVYTDMKSLMKIAEELHENTNISFVLGKNGRTQADDKYYLRHDGSGSSRANFDCLDSRIENQFLYTIYSDVDGNVWVTKDGAELGRISKTQKVDSLLSNAELKLLDDNTKLITNYISCIQRNAGNSRTGEQWHNEAFDGVSVLMTDISFDVGFGQGMSVRTNVLDPLLVAQAESKSDLYNFEVVSKLRSSVYVTTKTSSQADKRQEGYLGTLKAVAGMGDLETGLTDIQSMAYTKNFYIPNATVSDLN